MGWSYRNHTDDIVNSQLNNNINSSSSSSTNANDNKGQAIAAYNNTRWNNKHNWTDDIVNYWLELCFQANASATAIM